MTELERVTRLARELPWRELDAAQAERVRVRLLEDAEVTPQRSPKRVRSRIAVAVGLAAAAAAIAAGLFWPRGESAVVAPRAVVESDGASFTHELAGNEERVRLRSGRIRVRAEGGRAVRVVVGDAAIDLRAAETEIIAEDDHLAAVWATAGSTEVVRLGKTPVILGPGDRWSPAPKDVPAPVADVAEPPRPPRSVRASQGKASADELAFREGWRQYRAGAWEEAAKTLGRVARDGAWGEDACYWRGQALMRAHRDDDALRELSALLERYPGSRYAGEAEVTLGWMLLRRGRNAEAREHFQKAALDPGADIRESAQRGLSAASDR